MRPQLFAGGILVLLLGVFLYVSPLPLVLWSVPFALGGGVMTLASLFMSEGQGPILPPDGFRFCVFCSTPVALDSDRCSHCNGIQPRDVA
jgi:hypothetical protein